MWRGDATGSKVARLEAGASAPAERSTRMPRALRDAALLAVTLLIAGGCTARDPESKLDTRLWTDDLAVRIRLSPRPPRAREDIIVKVIVSDKETGAPIENGEGRIYAMSKDSVNIFDGLERGPEPGTYYAKLNFVTAGEWALGLQFRRDSTQKLQTMDDPPWFQTVRNAR